MIFSLNSDSISQIDLKETSADLFIFFKTPSSIEVPPEQWFVSICASLRMKKSVLILETPEEIPDWNEKKRWDVHDNWSWLAPRALSVISKAYGQNFSNYQEFKLFLKNSK